MTAQWLCVLVVAAGCSSSRTATKPQQSSNAANQTRAQPTGAIANRAEEPGPASPTDSPKRPVALTEAQVTALERLLVVMEALGAEVVAARADCEKAAAAMVVAASKLGPMRADIQKLEALVKNDAEVKAWFYAKYMDRMLQATAPLTEAANACGSNRDFRDAMNKLDGTQ